MTKPTLDNLIAGSTKIYLVHGLSNYEVMIVVSVDKDDNEFYTDNVHDGGWYRHKAEGLRELTDVEREYYSYADYAHGTPDDDTMLRRNGSDWDTFHSDSYTENPEELEGGGEEQEDD